MGAAGTDHRPAAHPRENLTFTAGLYHLHPPAVRRRADELLSLRMFAAPVRRLSVITSRFVYLIGLTAAQSAIILFAAYVLGVRYAAGLAGVAGCLAVGALFGAGVTSLSMVLAFTLRSHAQFFPITGFVGLPLTFVSSALVPLSLMPDWLRVLAGLNPMTSAIDAVRSPA